MPDQLESALVISLRETIKWESSLEVPAQGTLTAVDPALPFNPLTYQERDRQLAFRDLILGAAVVEASIQVSDIWNYPALKPRLDGPVNKDLPFADTEVTSAGTASQIRHVKNISIPWDAARYADSDLYGRDSLAYEILARACEQAFTDPPISRIDAAGTIFPDTSVWSLGEGDAQRRDINAALPLNRDLFKLPDQNLADRDNQMAGYVAQLAQVLKNPFEHAMRIYVRVDGPGTDQREAEIYSLTSDDGVNRVWKAEPALSNRNQIVYNISAKTLQWTRENVNEVHVPQIYAMTIPGIDAGQTLTTLPAVPETKDAQFWRGKAGLIKPTGEEITDTSAYLSFTASDAASGGFTQIGAASMTVPDMLTLTMNGSLSSGVYRVSVLAKPSNTVEIAGAQNVSDTSGTLGGATFEIDVPSGSIATKQYIVEGGDGIIYSGGTVLPGDSFSGISGTSTYSQVGASTSTVRQYAIIFNLALPIAPWTAKVEYTNLSGTTTGFGVKAQYVASGANAVDVIQDVVPLPFNTTNGNLVTSAGAGFDVGDVAQFSFPVYWTYGDGQLHVRKLVFESTTNTLGHYAVTGSLAGRVAEVDVFGTVNQPDVLRWDFDASGSVSPVVFGANWTADADIPVQFKQVQIQSIGTFDSTPVSSDFAGWRQECLERAERVIQQGYHQAVLAFGTEVPTFRSTGSTWNSNATEDWMSFVEVLNPRVREIPDISSDAIADGHQYEVVVGPVVYGSGTFSSGQKFYGVDSTGTNYSGGSVKQVGAFIKSLPGHVGRPALIPYGLHFDTSSGTTRAFYDTPLSVPTVVACAAWMVDVGVYVAQPDFWMPEFL
jgi:hypothetical protein